MVLGEPVALAPPASSASAAHLSYADVLYRRVVRVKFHVQQAGVLVWGPESWRPAHLAPAMQSSTVRSLGADMRPARWQLALQAL